LKKITPESLFRKELTKIMPGYEWTVHRPIKFSADDLPAHIEATGIQSAGFNRLSTLFVARREKDGHVTYEVKSSGFGVRAPWLAGRTSSTLARALRDLQTHYEHMASKYATHAAYLRNARKP